MHALARYLDNAAGPDAEAKVAEDAIRILAHELDFDITELDEEPPSAPEPSPPEPEEEQDAGEPEEPEERQAGSRGRRRRRD